MKTMKLNDVLPAGIGDAPAPAAKRRRWWLGTLPGCPRRNVTLGGVSFNFRTGDFGGTGGRLGAIAELTDEQVEKVFDAMAHRVCRKVGGGRPEIVDNRVRSYRHEDGDEPLAKYIYMMPEDKAHLISGATDWAHAGGAPSILEMLQRGDNEDAWCVGVRAKRDPEAERRDELERELAKTRHELAEMRAKLADEPEDGKGDPEPGEGGNDEPPTAEDRMVELDTYTVDQLVEYAEGQKFELPPKARKAEMITAIVEAERRAGLVA